MHVRNKSAAVLIQLFLNQYCRMWTVVQSQNTVAAAAAAAVGCYHLMIVTFSLISL